MKKILEVYNEVFPNNSTLSYYQFLSRFEIGELLLESNEQEYKDNYAAAIHYLERLKLLSNEEGFQLGELENKVIYPLPIRN